MSWRVSRKSFRLFQGLDRGVIWGVWGGSLGLGWRDCFIVLCYLGAICVNQDGLSLFFLVRSWLNLTLLSTLQVVFSSAPSFIFRPTFCFLTVRLLFSILLLIFKCHFILLSRTDFIIIGELMQSSLSDYTLFPITKQNIETVTKFASDSYVKSEPISVLIGTKAEEFSTSYDKIFKDACLSGLSFGYKSGDDIVAVLLVLEYLKYVEPIQGVPRLAPVEAIIEEIQESYLPKDPAKAVSIFFAVTHTAHTGKGLFFSLTQEMEKAARKKGFCECLAQCTNGKSQRVLVKLGYKIKSRIFYQKFEFNGSIPFKDIKDTDSMSYVVKELDSK